MKTEIDQLDLSSGVSPTEGENLLISDTVRGARMRMNDSPHSNSAMQLLGRCRKGVHRDETSANWGVACETC